MVNATFYLPENFTSVSSRVDCTCAGEDKPLAAVAALGAAAHEMLQVVYPDDIHEFGSVMEMFMEALAPHNTTNVVPSAAAWGTQVAVDIVEMRADDGHDAATPFRVCSLPWPS